MIGLISVMSLQTHGGSATEISEADKPLHHSVYYEIPCVACRRSSTLELKC